MEWASTGGKNHPDGSKWYGRMKNVTGVDFKDGTFEDFQRYFKCVNLPGNDCTDKIDKFPDQCSVPPCNKCNDKQGISRDMNNSQFVN